jgi:hypothetical protein
MPAYPTKTAPTNRSNYREASRKAHILLHSIEKQTRRKPYIRSAYFEKEKIFIQYFWPHLHQKHRRERIDRLRFLPCAIELIKTCRNKPVVKITTQEILYRFEGKSTTGETFYVQIKHDSKKNEKYFMSVFPQGK